MTGNTQFFGVKGARAGAYQQAGLEGGWIRFAGGEHEYSFHLSFDLLASLSSDLAKIVESASKVAPETGVAP